MKERETFSKNFEQCIWSEAAVGKKHSWYFSHIKKYRMPVCSIMKHFCIIRVVFSLSQLFPECAAHMLLNELMSCCTPGTNGCLELTRRAFALGRQVSAVWSSCLGSTARRARESVAPLRRTPAGWMPARTGRLPTGVGRRHPVTIRKASLLAGSMRRVWALRHWTGAQYSAVEWTRTRAAPQPEPASSFKKTTRDVSLLWSDSGCRRYVNDLSNVTPIYFGSEQKGKVLLLGLTFAHVWHGCWDERLPTPFLLCWTLVSKSGGIHLLLPILAQHPFHCLPVSISMHKC